MSTHPSQSLGLDSSAEIARPNSHIQAELPAALDEASRASRAETLQKNGKGMILAGFVITIVGVVLYCLACFAGGVDAGMGDILFRNAVPFARGTLGILGIGTLVWLIGSFTYLRGAMDADEDANVG